MQAIERWFKNLVVIIANTWNGKPLAEDDLLKWVRGLRKDDNS